MLPQAPLEKGELIGLVAEVTASQHAPYVGLRGLVVDETRGTFTLALPGGERVVPKEGQRFQFTLPDGSRQQVEGRALAHRPEDRTRKARSSPGRNAPTTR
jgi:ribonuclease P protein subunit POP4